MKFAVGFGIDQGAGPSTDSVRAPDSQLHCREVLNFTEISETTPLITCNRWCDIVVA